MGTYRPTFKLAVITPEALLYQNQVESVFITGDTGEYELLPYHFPLVGILAQGNIIINWKEAIPVRFGIVKFFANDCIILVEEPERLKKKKKKEEDIVIDADE
jgi:F0F1-type ATP synthase epsilon subunit